nr:hypothetical protein [Endozoicomonas sp.]
GSTQDPPPSTSTINEVIASCYRFVSGQGYQLIKQALTYQEVVTGECLNQEPPVIEGTALNSAADSIAAQSPSDVSVYAPSESTPVTTTTSGQPLINDIINNQPSLLEAINTAVDHIASLPDNRRHSNPLAILKTSLRGREWTIPDSNKALNKFMAEYRRLGEQQRRVVTLSPHKNLAGYLENLRTQTGRPDLALSDKIWVSSQHNGLRLLIPYKLQAVLSGALSRYEAAQLILPQSLERFRTEWVAEDLVDQVRSFEVEEALPPVTTTPGQSLITRIINNQPSLLKAINKVVDHTASLPDNLRHSDPFAILKASLRGRTWTIPDSNKALNNFMAEYRQLSEQQRKTVTFPLPLPKELASYMDMLQPAEGPSTLDLSDSVWVRHPDKGLQLLIPYTVKEVLSGALSGYDPKQLIVPPVLDKFRRYLVHEHFAEIIHNAHVSRAGVRGSLHNYLEMFDHYSEREQQRALATVQAHDPHQLKGYLRVLRSLETYFSLPAEGRDELKLSDKVWVRLNSDETLSVILPVYRVGEVLSGALSGYDPETLILPWQLEKYRHIITVRGFADILHQACQEHCNTDSIKRNQAPRDVLGKCMHFSEKLQDNRFILSTINKIVNEIVVYEPDLMETVIQWLAAKAGTRVYKDEQLETYKLEFEQACQAEKDRRRSEPPLGEITWRSEEQRQGFLNLIQPGNDTEQLTLSDRIWVRFTVNGLRLLVPYTLEEALQGALAGMEIKRFLVPPAVERWLPDLTNENVTSILDKAYKADMIETIRAPIAEKLNRLAYPLTNLKINVQIMMANIPDFPHDNLDLHTTIGYYKTVTLSPDVHGKAGIGRSKKTDIQPYTVLDVIINTGKAINARNAFKNIVLSPQYNNQMMRSLVKSLTEMNWEKQLNEFANDCREDNNFINSLRQLMKKNSELYPPPDTLNQYMIHMGTTTNAHPFVVALIEHKGAREKVAGLYSYLTGKRFTFDQNTFGVADHDSRHVEILPDKFAAAIKNEKDSPEIFRWMMENGGDSALRELSHGLQFYTDLNHKMSWTWSGGGGAGYFIKTAPTRLASVASMLAEDLHSTYEEVEQEASDKITRELFNLFKDVVGVIGMIPVVGDLVDIVGTYAIYELEMAWEKDVSLLKKLEKEQKVAGSITLTAGFVPGASSLLTHIFKGLSDGLSITIKKVFKTGNPGIVAKNSDIVAKNSDIVAKKPVIVVDGSPIKIGEFELIDGSPNTNHYQRVIEPDSKTFGTLCSTVNSRIRRAGDSAECAPVATVATVTEAARLKKEALRDSIITPDLMKYVVRREDDVVVAYFRNPATSTTASYKLDPMAPSIDVYPYLKDAFFRMKADADKYVADLKAKIESGPTSTADVDGLRRRNNGSIRSGWDFFSVQAKFDHTRKRAQAKCLAVDMGGRVIGTNTGGSWPGTFTLRGYKKALPKIYDSQKQVERSKRLIKTLKDVRKNSRNIDSNWAVLSEARKTLEELRTVNTAYRKRAHPGIGANQDAGPSKRVRTGEEASSSMGVIPPGNKAIDPALDLDWDLDLYLGMDGPLDPADLNLDLYLNRDLNPANRGGGPDLELSLIHI